MNVFTQSCRPFAFAGRQMQPAAYLRCGFRERRPAAKWHVAAGALVVLFFLSLTPASAGDPFAGTGDDLLGPAQYAAAVTPSDSAYLPTDSKRLFVGGAGNVKVETVGFSIVTYTSVPAGTYLPGASAAQVFATGTTATNIIAEW